MNIKKVITIVILFFIFAAVLIFMFRDKIFPNGRVVNNETKQEDLSKKDLTQDYLIEMKTDKIIYNQNEPVNISIINKGKNGVWLFFLPKQCERELYFSVQKYVKDDYWMTLSTWCSCFPSGVDFNSIETKKINSQESVESFWDKKIPFGYDEAYAESGIYKIVLHYSKNEITKDNRDGESSIPIDVFSNEFEIKPSSENSYVSDQLKIEYDIMRKSSLRRIKSALEAYANNNGKYPISNEISKLNNGSSKIRKELMGYFGSTDFQDPKYPEFYYGYKSDGTYFELSARFENLNDEECELVKSDLCIYKIDSKGDTSKRE